MLRKIIIMIVMMVGTISVFGALPFDKYSINRNDLPEAAKEMLDEYFPKAKVSMIKVDRHMLKKTEFEVMLTHCTKMLFSN